MNFADLRFWGLLLTAVGVVLLIRLPFSKAKEDTIGVYDRASLGLIGLFLLACVSLQTLIIFASVSVITFGGLHLILHCSANKRTHLKWLCLLIILQLAPLLWYKYGDFVGNGIFQFELPGLVQLAIPVGISFYTFQLIAFAVDTLVHQKPIPSAINSLNFAGFFPQIVAGPIERRDSLLPQLESFRYRWNKANFEEGLTWIVVGLFFKRCLADNLALLPLIHPGTNVFLVWLDALLFGFRIYFDFAGYSLMALGVAICFGIRLTLNFRSPYCASNITDFWRRWHVTLSTWFRDYIYIPMRGSRTKFWAANIMVVFIVSGIWHGAGWNFVAWGALHGVFLIIHRLSPLKLPAFLGYGLTHLGVFFAWICFFETDPSELFRKLALLVNPLSYGPATFKAGLHQVLSPAGFNVVVMLSLILGVTLLERWSMRKGKNECYSILREKWVLAVLVFLTIILSPTADNEFIYFAF